MEGGCESGERVAGEILTDLGRSKLPAGVASVMEIILNGRDLPTIAEATRRAVEAALDAPGLVRISAGNYSGRLGKSFIYLYPERQLAAT